MTDTDDTDDTASPPIEGLRCVCGIYRVWHDGEKKLGLPISADGWRRVRGKDYCAWCYAVEFCQP